jgi:phosphatidate cytidylyltransferase
MFKTRVISAVSMLIIFFMSFFIFDPWAFIALSSSVSIIALYELARVLKLKLNQKIIFCALSLSTFLYFYCFNISNINTIFFASLIFWFLFAPLHILKKFLLPPSLKLFFGIILIIPLWSSILWLFSLNKLFLLYIFVSIFIADIGAYIFGKKFGKHKLMHDVSPGKTIEGVLGALLLNFIFSFFLSFYVSADLLLLIIASILITLLSIFGDLYESLLKRISGIKDSGSIIPGHGGILDRIDGFCPTIPIFALIFNYLYALGIVL